MGVDDVYLWLSEYLDKFSLDKFSLGKTFDGYNICFNEFYNANIYFNFIGDDIIVNSRFSLEFSHLNMKELPFKFGHIDGDFINYGGELESFKNFPDIVEGRLAITNNNFKDGKDWKIKSVKGSINFCGEKCEFKNLSFLENTKFDKFELKVKNSIFINDLNINDLEIYKNIILENNYHIKYGELYKVLECHINENELDNYLNNFNNEIKRESHE